MLRRVFDVKPRLVGVLAEVDLKAVGALGQHVDVGTGAEHAIATAADDDHAHLGMAKAQALHGVGQLDIDAQVVRVELELIARHQRLVLTHGHV